MKCIVCGEREATVPDRNQGGIGRRIKKVCSVCHQNRLKNDLVDILLIEKKRNELRKNATEAK